VIGESAARVEIEYQAPRPGDLRESSADISRARALLGYEPRLQLAEGLADVVDFFRSSMASASGNPRQSRSGAAAG
jgi:nucleoside-diphosphate-sugar epimerase